MCVDCSNAFFDVDSKYCWWLSITYRCGFKDLGKVYYGKAREYGEDRAKKGNLKAI
ncbi:hypothetical protein MIDIC_460010 [Alphaproteobacteria bacterium]